MSPSTFSFGFSDDDIAMSSDEEETTAARNVKIDGDDDDSFASAGGDDGDDDDGNDDDEDEELGWAKAEAIPLDDLIQTLPSQISYNLLPISVSEEGCDRDGKTNDASSSSSSSSSSATPTPPTTIHIPRREVFDIRAQLMAETDLSSIPTPKLLGQNQTAPVSVGARSAPMNSIRGRSLASGGGAAGGVGGGGVMAASFGGGPGAPERDAVILGQEGAGINNEELIAGLKNGDINPRVYEGGFKTWECAVDLARVVLMNEELRGLFEERGDDEYHDNDGDGDGDEANNNDDAQNDVQEVRLIELGAGTSIPSLSLLHTLLSQPITSFSDSHTQRQRQRRQQQRHQRHQRRRYHFVFADYNAAVLRLVTLPNILLTWWHCRQKELQQLQQGDVAGGGEDFDLDIDGALLDAFRAGLAARGIRISFIAGAWSPSFVDMALPVASTAAHSTATSSPEPDTDAKDEGEEGEEAPPTSRKLLVLASETIYSPTSLRAFSETVLELLRRGGGGGGGDNGNGNGNGQRKGNGKGTQESSSSATALVAAKKVYFGVGGGVDEFLDVLRSVEQQQQQQQRTSASAPARKRRTSRAAKETTPLLPPSPAPPAQGQCEVKEVLDVANAGVGRVVLRLELR